MVPFSWYIRYAPSMKNEPWEKLMTPIRPRMMFNPSATRIYSIPNVTPLTSWSRNWGADGNPWKKLTRKLICADLAGAGRAVPFAPQGSASMLHSGKGLKLGQAAEGYTTTNRSKLEASDVLGSQ